jgi:serine/threonine protein kinase
MDLFDFATCPEGLRSNPSRNIDEPEVHRYSKAEDEVGLEVSHYLFMEKIDSSLEDWGKCIFSSRPTAEGVLVQILHTICVYQKLLSLQHNDLHSGNIFIERITFETKFRGVSLHDADYFHYRIGKVNLYLPFIPVLIKIGDFGLSVKYSAPLVGNLAVVAGGLSQDGKPHVPNDYTLNFDLLYILGFFLNGISVTDESKEIARGIFEYIMNKSLTGEDMEKIYSEIYQSRGTILKSLSKLKRANPRKILTQSKCMKKYTVKPPLGAKIVTLGKVD